MRNRDMQKALRRAQKAGLIPEQIAPRPRTVEKPWLNPEGYADPTAYNAIRNIERDEKQTREEENKRKRELAEQLIAQGILETGHKARRSPACRMSS